METLHSKICNHRKETNEEKVLHIRKKFCNRSIKIIHLENFDIYYCIKQLGY